MAEFPWLVIGSARYVTQDTQGTWRGCLIHMDQLRHLLHECSNKHGHSHKTLIYFMSAVMTEFYIFDINV